MGKELGHYRLGDALFEDAAGRWYRARDERFARDVLVLVFHTGALSGGRDGMLASARALSKLEHRNVAPVHAFDTVDGVDFLVSEWAAGGSPAVQFGGRTLRDADLVRFGAQVADGLSAAHQAGVVHGCLDADHVRVDTDGVVKVIGFGLPERPAAWESSAGVSGMALSFCAPERLRGEAATVQSDVYSLGVLLYELATGVRPFAGDSPDELLSSISEHSARGVRKLNGHVSVDTERVILKCLEAVPHRRYALAGDVAAALRGKAGTGAGSSAVSVGRGRSGSLVMLAIVAMVLGWAGLVWYRTGFRMLPGKPPSGEVTNDH